MNIPKDTLVRTLVLLITLINQILELTGKNPLPFSNEQWYELLSGLLTVITSLWVWWKNNVFTKEAVRAEAYRRKLKLEKNQDAQSKKRKGERYE